MIYKISFEDGQVDWCTAKDQLHLLKSYDHELGLDLQSIESIEEISEEESKTITVLNTEYDEDDPDDVEQIPLWDLAVGNDFCVIASSEFI